MKQLGDILLEGGLVTADQLDAAVAEHQRLGPQPGPRPRRPRRAHRVPARRSRSPRRSACASSTSPTSRSTAPRSRGPRARLPAAHGAPDRVRGRQAGRGHGRPGQRVRHRRHQVDRRQRGRRRQAGRRHAQTTCVAAIDRYYRADDELDDLTTEHGRGRGGGGPRQGQGDRPRTPRSSATSTCSSPRPSRTAPPTSTSSRPSTTCACATASTACCTRSCARRRAIQSGVISRLKIMADINIAERRIPQDGRLSVDRARQEDRPARRDPAHGVGREGRHANPRQLHGAPGPRRPRVQPRQLRRSSRSRTSSPTG